MNLERDILNALDALPDGRMLGSVGILGALPAGNTATLNDVESKLRTLVTLREVVGIDRRDGTLYQITPAGKARIAF